jgi:quercetin dioxygenase-like cupin family protein
MWLGVAMSGIEISTFPIHLGLGATAETEPAFTGEVSWYGGYSERHASDGAEGRLVTMHRFTESWDVWEMHPVGAEVVLCVAGTVTLIQEIDGTEVATTITAGEYVINGPGVWHTADVAPGESPQVLFITAGEGTEHRSR